MLFFNLSTGSLVKRVELADVIADKEKSKCRCKKVVEPRYQRVARFLTRGFSGSLVITDLGMDRCVVFQVLKAVNVHCAGFISWTWLPRE